MFTKKFSVYIIIFICVITGVLGFFISTLKFNFDFESYFPSDDQDRHYYVEFRNTFENDADYLLIGIRNEPSVFQSDFLLRVDSLAEELKKVKNVEFINSPTRMRNFIIGRPPKPYLHIKRQEKLAQDSALVFKYQDLIGSFFSPNGQSLAIIVKLKNLVKEEESFELYANLLAVINKYDFVELHMAGKLQAENVYINQMKSEMQVFFVVSATLIFLFLFLAFRSVSGVILPLTIIGLAGIWSLGIMGLTNQPIDLMTLLLPTIMFVVGMSDVIHIYSKYLDELRQDKSKKEALRVTIKEVGLATFLTSFTTAVGFFTLLTSRIEPIQNFGIYCGIGVFLAFIIAFTLLPAILFLLPKPKVSTKKTTNLVWHRILHRGFQFTLKNRKLITGVSVIIIGIAVWGITKVEINSFLIDEVDDDQPLKKDFEFFEQNFGGARPFELSVRILENGKNTWDYDVLLELNKIQNYLEEVYGVSQIMSPVTFVKGIHRAKNNGFPNQFIIPETKEDYKQIKKYTTKYAEKREIHLWSGDKDRLVRFSGKMSDCGSIKAYKREQALYAWVKQNIDQNKFDVHVTGSAPLIDKSNREISENMIQGLGIAFLIIAVIMGLLYKSFKIILVSLIPNIIPLLIIGGFIGLSGIGLKLSTSVIFTVAFGIAVDDTIHFMSKLKLELRKGKSMIYAIKRTFISTGRAIILTSLILVGGFLTLLFSNFNGTFYTGLFVSMTLFFAVIADLFLIPVLLFMFYHKELTSKNIIKTSDKKA